MMYQYGINDYSYHSPEPPQPRVKKYKKQTHRTSRRSLKKEFEKLLIPAFTGKLAESSPAKCKKKQYFRAKKGPKNLPDNLADFIVDNEAVQPSISEEEYSQCMDVLTSGTHRKNQVLQVCQILGIDREAIAKKRRSHNIRFPRRSLTKCGNRKSLPEITPSEVESLLEQTPVTNKNEEISSVISSIDEVTKTISENLVSKGTSPHLPNVGPLLSTRHDVEELRSDFLQTITRSMAESAVVLVSNEFYIK